MIVASLCTIPERKDSFGKVLHRILCEQSLRVDELHVWLNGYKEQPADLLHDARVRYHLHPENPGPWIRYRAAERLTERDVLVTLDDDLVYPSDYIEACLHHLSDQSSSPVLTFGGMRWDPCVEEFEYGNDRFHYSYADKLSDFRTVAALMGGVSSFRAGVAKKIHGVSFAGFEFNDDLLCSYTLQKNNIEILCAPKKSGWINEDDTAHLSHALYMRDSPKRKAGFRGLVQNSSFDASAGALEKFMMRPHRVLVVSDACPPFEESGKLHEHLVGSCENQSSVHLLAPAGGSQVSLIHRHVDVPYFIHAVAVSEEGGRLNWLAPVRNLRNHRVKIEAERKFWRRLDVVMRKLKPTRVEWFGSSAPHWWIKRFGHETVVHFN